jgi:DegV family protein with EDD domain
LVVKIVTDSCSDISQLDAQKLGIAVVAAYVNFGDQAYRDGIDLSVDEFYARLQQSGAHPTTATPSPGDFAAVYSKLCDETDEIVSIHVTKRHSALIESARIGKQLLGRDNCRIEVIDSAGVTIWQALVVLAAAETAAAGGSLQQVMDKAYDTIKNLQGVALLDTLSYAVRGGRLKLALLKAESILNVKAMLTLRNGEVRLAGLARNRARGMQKLHHFIKSAAGANIQAAGVAYNTPAGEAQELLDTLKSRFPYITPTICRMGPTLGTHTGPGTVAVAVVRNSS